MYKVYLSPSTQVKNLGVGNYGIEEKRMNELADILEPMLVKKGIKVYRNKPTMTLKQAVADSNAKNPDLHLAIHSNAFNGTSRGCEVYYYKSGCKGQPFAQNVYKNISALTPTSDRGVQECCNFFGQGKPLYEPRYTNAPCALVEVAFHDQAEDAAWIIDNLKPLANALYKAVLETLKIKYTEEDINDMTVKEFQAMTGLQADGIAGPKTKAKAKEVLQACQNILGGK